MSVQHFQARNPSIDYAATPSRYVRVAFRILFYNVENHSFSEGSESAFSDDCCSRSLACSSIKSVITMQ